MRLRTTLAVLSLAALVTLAGFRAATADDESAWKPLFNGKNFDGWTKYFPPKSDANPDEVFTIKDGVISCTGKPTGYIITDREYDNFILKFEWRFPGKPGNSGCFVRVVGDNKIWPKGIEAQLQSGAAGDIWLVDGAKLTIDPDRQDPKVSRHYFRLRDKREDGQPIENPLGEWNTYEIKCDGGNISLIINGTFVNEGIDCDIATGQILLQSEGAPIEFRNIMIRDLPDQED